MGSKPKERVRKLPSSCVLHLDLGNAFAFELSSFDLSLLSAHFLVICEPFLLDTCWGLY